MNKNYQRRHLKFSDAISFSPLRISNFGYHDFNYIKSSNVLHVQVGYTLHFVQKGGGTLQIKDKVYDVVDGDFFFLPPNVEMRYLPKENAPWAYYWFYLIGDGAKELGLSMGFSLTNPIRHSTNPKEVDKLLNSLFIGAFSQEERYFKTLSTLYDIASKLSTNKKNAEYVCNSDIVENIKEIIKLNHKDPDFSVDCLSELTFISQSYICKLFKNKTGISTVQYLVKERLKSAATMLKEKDFPVKKLAFLVGFKDELHFMKAFKKEYGITVKEFRQKYAQKNLSVTLP